MELPPFQNISRLIFLTTSLTTRLPITDEETSSCRRLIFRGLRMELLRQISSSEQKSPAVAAALFQVFLRGDPVPLRVPPLRPTRGALRSPTPSSSSPTTSSSPSSCRPSASSPSSSAATAMWRTRTAASPPTTTSSRPARSRS